jgi:hypothetical protein
MATLRLIFKEMLRQGKRAMSASLRKPLCLGVEEGSPPRHKGVHEEGDRRDAMRAWFAAVAEIATGAGGELCVQVTRHRNIESALTEIRDALS